MTKEEMLKSLAGGQDPLTVSIQKWRDIVNGVGVDLGSKNCALCNLFYNEFLSDCEDCPIMISTGLLYCKGTPYEDFEDDDLESAKRMLTFLESLQKS